MPNISGSLMAWLLAAGLCITSAGAEEAGKAADTADKPAEEAPTITSVFGIEPLKVYALPFEDKYPTGPFEILDDKHFLFVGKCGQVYFTRLGGKLELEHAAGELRKPAADDAGAFANPVYCKEFTGVKDSLRVGDKLLVAYTIWDAKLNGIRLAVSEFTLDTAAQTLAFTRDVYVSDPAIKEPILGNQVGGKMTLGENDGILYLAIGDFSRPEFVQDKQTSLGKVLRIELSSLRSQVWATGVRSPSGGLFYDRKSSQLWLTDHGPQGGDEINLIQRGRNYGWPLVSYGTMYERGGMGNYYGGNGFNTHEGYTKPAMTFVPSVGVGPIARYPDNGKNEYWENDYFVAGMGANTLYRIRKEDEHLVYAEPVLKGYRIRSIKFDNAGNFYLKTDNNQLLLSDSSKKRMP